jgi:hypothetical protein
LVKQKPVQICLRRLFAFGIPKIPRVSNLRFIPAPVKFSDDVPVDCHPIVTDPIRNGHLAPAI